MTTEAASPRSQASRRYALVLSALIVSGSAGGAFAAERIRIAFRYDDYSAVSPYNVDAAVIHAFAERALPLAIGVIPARTDADGSPVAFSAPRIQLLESALEQELTEIVLHGYDHRPSSSDPYPTEFRGISLEQQLQKIRAGRDLLEDLFGSRPVGFIPPWNTYDRNTLRALEQEQFEYVSGDFHWAPRATSSVADIPSTCGLRNLRSALRDLSSPSSAGTVVVMFHPHDFAESGEDRAIWTLRELHELLDWVVAQPDVVATSLHSALAASVTPEHVRSLVQSVQVGKTVLPPPLTTPVRYIPAEPGEIAAIRIATWLRVLGFSATLLLLGAGCAILALRAARVPSRAQKRLAGIVSIAVLGGAAYALHDGDIGFKGVVALLPCLGILVGAVFQAFFLRRKLLYTPSGSDALA